MFKIVLNNPNCGLTMLIWSSITRRHRSVDHMSSHDLVIVVDWLSDRVTERLTDWIGRPIVIFFFF